MITVICALVASIATLLIARYRNNKKIESLNEAHDAELVKITLLLFNSAERLGMLYKRNEDKTVAEMLTAINQ